MDTLAPTAAGGTTVERSAIRTVTDVMQDYTLGVFVVGDFMLLSAVLMVASAGVPRWRRNRRLKSVPDTEEWT